MREYVAINWNIKGALVIVAVPLFDLIEVFNSSFFSLSILGEATDANNYRQILHIFLSIVTAIQINGRNVRNEIYARLDRSPSYCHFALTLYRNASLRIRRTHAFTATCVFFLTLSSFCCPLYPCDFYIYWFGCFYWIHDNFAQRNSFLASESQNQTDVDQ